MKTKKKAVNKAKVIEKKYVVTMIETRHIEYLVTATNREEANQKVIEGEYTSELDNECTESYTYKVKEL